MAAADLFPTLGDGPGYTVVMDTDVQDITGRWVTNNLVGRGPSPSQGVAVNISASRDDERVGPELTLGYLPINEGLTSAPVIVNTGTAATGVTLFFHDQAGTSLIPEGYRIEACLNQFICYFPGNSSTTGRILSIGNHKIRTQFFLQRSNLVDHESPTRTSNDIS